jgi:hypothetical protein
MTYEERLRELEKKLKKISRTLCCQQGISGTFTDGSGNTIVVTNGIVTEIIPTP